MIAKKKNMLMNVFDALIKKSIIFFLKILFFNIKFLYYFLTIALRTLVNITHYYSLKMHDPLI